MSDLPSLERAYMGGRQAHPEITLTLAAFAAERDAANPPAAAEDYYLARACDVGADGAWERLRCCYGGLLRMYLLALGAGAAEAEQLLDEAWSTLAAPPPDGRRRTRIGTYDGRGSLHAWLATVLRRRLAERWHARTPNAPPEVMERAPSPHEADPVAQSAEAELSSLLGAALEEAWGGLTLRERQAIVLMYRHHLPQTEIARRLDVGPPRVTRLLQTARARLRAFIDARFGTEVFGREVDGCSARLLANVESILARDMADASLPSPRPPGPD